MTFCVLAILAIVSHHPNEHPASILDLWRANQLENFLGIVGAYISYYLVFYTFGYAFMAVPILFFVYGWLLFTHKSIFLVNQFAFYILTLMVLVSVWVALPYTDVPGAGWSASGFLGGMIATQLFVWLNKFGSITVWVVLSLLWIILVTRISIADLIPSIQHIFVSSYRRTSETVSRFKNRQTALLEDAEKQKEVQSDVPAQKEEKPLIPQYLQTEKQTEEIRIPEIQIKEQEPVIEVKEKNRNRSPTLPNPNL